MQNRLIPASKALGYSDIYLDFVAGNDPPLYLYLGADNESVARRLDIFPHDRDRMAQILSRQNTAFGASGRAHENIAKLTDPRTVCVFAGQQAGFLGGPLFTIIKAVAVVQAAKKYEQELGRPVVPMFWIAGDDHDFEEVNHTYLLNRSAEPCRIGYATPPENEVSTAAITFSDVEALDRARQCMRECLGDTDFTPRLYEIIDAAYAPGETFVSAFGRLMAALTAELGVVLFSPADPDVKRYAVPFFLDVLTKQDELCSVINEINREIAGLGYDIQVAKKECATHLFCDLDGRKPIHRDGDMFVVGEQRFSEAELRGLIEDAPQRFSPDVLLRPVLQSYLFPTVSQKGGPSEIAYLAQVNPLFQLFGLPAPVHRARPTATVVERHIEKLMDEYDVGFEDLTGDIEQVINRILMETFPEDLESHFQQLRGDVEGRFDQFIRESLQFDPSLKPVAKQIYGKIDYSLKAFESKVFSAHKKRSKQTRDRIYRIWQSLYPNRMFQERCLSAVYFVSKYGFDFAAHLARLMDSEETAHQLLYLSALDD